MKVILLSDVYKHGVAGEVVDVADGFARNWLLPKNLAVKASQAALQKHEEMLEQAAARKAALEGRLNDLAHQIDGVELIFGRRASPTGKLFGSVTTSEIADALNEKTGIDINRRRISQTQLREVGTHDVPIRLGTEISPVLKVLIVREEDYAKVLAQKAAGEEVAIEEAVAEAEVEAIEEAVIEAEIEAVEEAIVEAEVEAVEEAIVEAEIEAVEEAIVEAEIEAIEEAVVEAEVEAVEEAVVEAEIEAVEEAIIEEAVAEVDAEGIVEAETEAIEEAMAEVKAEAANEDAATQVVSIPRPTEAAGE